MKKRGFTRIALLLLAILMLVSAVSCQNETPNEGPGTTGATEEQTSEIDLIEQLPTVKYNYDDFTFLIRDMTDFFADVIVEEVGAESSEVDKAVYERNEAIMERYEVDFQYVKKKQDAEFKAEVVNANGAGQDVYDVVVGHGRNVFEGVLAGLYTDWNEMEYLNLEESWWNQSARTSFATPGGKLFAMNGDLSYYSVGSANCMFFNKTTIADAGLKSPYDMVDDDEWTLENFITMIMDVGATLPENDTNDIKTGSFGYATQQWRGPIYSVYSTGTQGLLLQEDGTYVIGFADERVGTAFSKYREFVMNFDTAFWGANDSDLALIRDAFSAGAVCFTDDNIFNAVVFKGTEVDYGIVPWPKYESTDKYVARIGSGTNTFAVMANTSDSNLSRIGLILEAMAVYGHVDVIPYYFETVLSLQASKDARTRDMLQVIHENLSVDFSEYTNFGGIADVPRNTMKNPGEYGTTLSTGVAKVRSAVMQKLEDWYALDVLTDK